MFVAGSSNRFMAIPSDSLTQATVMSVSSDAKRLGNPAEEVTIFAAWSADADRSAWLPPMVAHPLLPQSVV